VNVVSILADGWVAGGATAGGVLALVLAVIALVSIVRDENLSGGSKALWVVIVLFLPILGPIVYFAVRSDW
jgi:Phospholipase_D-nuclease N-terminal